MAVIRVTTDYPTIQAAVDAALPGDEILVADGVYHEQVTVSSNFLRITGGEKTVLDGAWTLDTAFTLNDTSGVEIRSFLIKDYKTDGVDILGNGMANAVTQTRLINIGDSAVRQDAAATDSRIAGCSVSGAETGVLDAGSRLCVEGCRILYCRTGISCADSSVDAEISGSAVNGNATGISTGGVRTRISRNEICENRSNGISVSGSDCLIEGNDVHGTVSYAAIDWMGEGGTVRGNRVCFNGSYGISAGSTGIGSILGNEVCDNADIGILLTQPGNVVADNRARGNGRFDLARLRAQNIVRGNDCGRSLPPYLCRECAREEPAEPPGGDGAAACPAADLRVPDDYPTIQQAVDAAGPGDVILVADGVYHEQVTVEKSWLKIIGGGRTVLDGEGKRDVGFLLNGTNGVEIRSFRIENYRSDGVDIYGGEGNLLAQVGIFDAWYFGVYLDAGTKNNRIWRCGIEGAFDGIYDGSAALRVEESRLSCNGNCGVYNLGDGMQLIGCEIESNYDNGVLCIGDGVRISACRIARNLQSGVRLEGGSVVEDSEISFNANFGVMLLGGGSTARNNRACSNGEYGVYSSNNGGNVVSGNRANHNKMNGIVVLDGNLVTGNTAHENGMYDMVRLETASVFRDNDCTRCLPPWICGGALPPEAARRPAPCGETATIVVPDDYPTIQEAVDAARSLDIILVKNGVYHEQVTVAQNRIRLIGEAQTVLDGEGGLESGLIVPDTFEVEIRSFTVRNYTGSGVAVTGDSHEITLAGLCVLNCYDGLRLERGTANCLIAGCGVVGNGSVGIAAFASNLRIEDCRVLYNGSSAVVAYCDLATIRRNTVCNNFGNGINCQVTGSAVITGNTLRENRVTALVAYGDSVVRDNEVSHNYGSGIGTAHGTSVVAGNRSCGNTKPGITVNVGACVTGNEVRYNGGFGLYVASAENVVADNTVLGNKVYDIVINQSGNRARGNVCGKSVPPRVCGGCRPAPEHPLEIRGEDAIESA